VSILSAYLCRASTQRVLSKKPGQEGFSLLELVAVIAVLAVLAVIALLRFEGVLDKAVASAGKKYLLDVYTECFVARTSGSNVNVTAPNINRGAFMHTAPMPCPNAEGTLQTFTPDKTTIPIFSIDLYSGVKTCALRGNPSSYGCPDEWQTGSTGLIGSTGPTGWCTETNHTNMYRQTWQIPTDQTMAQPGQPRRGTCIVDNIMYGMACSGGAQGSCVRHVIGECKHGDKCETEMSKEWIIEGKSKGRG